VLQHPFYQAWNRGELTHDALRDYAEQYYHHVSAFSDISLGSSTVTHGRTLPASAVNNLNDEEGGDPTHPQLWLGFARGLGLTDGEVEATPAQPETLDAVEAFRDVCRNEHMPRVLPRSTPTRARFRDGGNQDRWPEAALRHHRCGDAEITSRCIKKRTKFIVPTSERCFGEP